MNMRKLAIVGSHSSTRALAPFDNPDYDIWVFNEAAQQSDWCKRWTVCFQLHSPEIYTSPMNMINSTHWDWLQKDHGEDHTIWMQDVDPRVPNSRRFPLDEIRAGLPAARYGYFTSTVAMALAAALWLGYEIIEVWGVELSSNTEYAYQASCWQFWVGAATAMLGDNFILHSGELHFRQRIYGYEGNIEIEPEYYTGRVAYLDQELYLHQSKLNKLKSRLADAAMERKPDVYRELLPKAQNEALAAGTAAGALAEAKFYESRTDPINRHQFERRGAQAQNDLPTNQGSTDRECGKLDYVWNVWRMTSSYEALKQVRTFTDSLLNLQYNAGATYGVMQENFHYMSIYDERLLAAGGVRARKAVLGEAV